MFKKLLKKLRPSSEKLDFVYDQAVILTIYFDGLDDFGSKEQQQSIENLEGEIASLLPANSGIDGDEFGDGECIVYIYGPSADKIFSSIKSELKKSPFNRIDITLQYGQPDSPSAKDRTFSF